MTRKCTASFALIAALAIGLFAPGIAWAAASWRAPAGAIALPFTLWDNRVVLPVMVNGHGPYQFILDTGAGSGASVSMGLFKTLGLHAAGSEDGGGAGEATQMVLDTRVDQLVVGPLVESNLDVTAIEFQSIADGIGLPAMDGVLGDDLFRRYVVTVDYTAQRLWLQEPQRYVVPAGAQVVPFTIYEGNIPVTDGAISQHPGRFLIDLGDRSNLTLFRPFWAPLALDQAPAITRNVLTGFGVGGPIRAHLVPMNDLELSGNHIGNTLVRLSLQTKGVFADPQIAGSVGAGVLRHFVTTFDYPHGRLILEQHAASVDETALEPADRAGMWIGRTNGRATVLDVLEDGPAFVSGIRVGDVVVALDGVAVGPESILAARERLKRGDSHSVRIALRRDGKPLSVVVALRTLP